MSNQFYRDTWVDIDLDAIQHNVQKVKEQIRDGVSLMAVVKANAYGHGYIQVANAALEAGADHLAVAFLDEALFLRKAGITAPILVLGATRPEDVGLASRHQIQLTVYQDQWIEQAASYLNEAAPVLLHLKCDTGMGRLGIKSIKELQDIEQMIERYPSFEIYGVFTHFATADERSQRYADEQLVLFNNLIGHLKKKPKMIHASNSAATLLRQDALFTLVRFGISMYGLSPSDEIAPLIPKWLKPALSLHTRLVHVKRVKKGDKISYGSTYTAIVDEWIGTLPIGYADGWLRKLQGFEVLINGQRAPIVGRVCMDQCMIRLPKDYPLGMKVTLIGEQDGERILIDDVANYLETIHYEVACLIAARVPRVYWQNKKPKYVLNQLI
ncbi:alanine racemase [Jeotgalibacillus soli]|uniref:alanine racemase n=1 Tax=Jeotgalibacillus soli TaxID=889306 RepID=UPI000597A87F|nr:alanine racemase [Jeotgalibacillus soli]